jgi:hypothetical protein
MGEGREALDVLRSVWDSQDQNVEDIEDCESPSGCKRLKDAGVGYGGANEEDRAANWKDRLQREGKLSTKAPSLRDLVLGKEAS